MASIQQGPNGPVLVLKESALQQKGRDAQQNNITAAKLVADLVKSSLGPRGLDKMLGRLARGRHDYKRRRHDPKGDRRAASRRQDDSRDIKDRGQRGGRRHHVLRGVRGHASGCRRGAAQKGRPLIDHRGGLPGGRREDPGDIRPGGREDQPRRQGRAAKGRKDPAWSPS